MQCRADQFVRHVGPVVLGGVDVVDAEFDRAPEHGDRLVTILWRSPDVGAGELHRPEADPVHGTSCELVGLRPTGHYMDACLKYQPAQHPSVQTRTGHSSGLGPTVLHFPVA